MDSEELRLIDAIWRAANYLSVGQIYLQANSLLREPLPLEHVKRRLLGHWGTTPGLIVRYVHLNRVISPRDIDAGLYDRARPWGSRPGRERLSGRDLHRGLRPYREDDEGIRRLFSQFSFPGGIPWHVAPETPGSIHEGGDLAIYSFMPMARYSTTWLCSRCASSATGKPKQDRWRRAGTRTSSLTLRATEPVLPVLHLNGYKIAGPTVLARIGEDELRKPLEGYGHAPLFVAGEDPDTVHQELLATLDADPRRDSPPSRTTRASGIFNQARPRWPMIVLRTPKGWTGPEERRRPARRGDVPSTRSRWPTCPTKPDHLKALERGSRSYRPEELFDEAGRLLPELRALRPEGIGG